jgi:PAS domain S-box-containing protein
MKTNFYNNLFDHINEAIISLNEKFEIESGNKMTNKLLGTSESEIKNKSIDSIFYGLGNIIEQKFASTKGGLQNDLIEIQACRKNGKQFLAEISLSKWNFNSNPVYTLLIRDITDQRREQEALIKAEALIEGRLEVENTRLLEEERKLLLLQEDLRLASEIQQKLLPKSSPKIPGYDIAAVNIPAKEVGGDYFDFIPISKGRIIFCLGDVSGKGMPASLIMSNLQATLHTQSLIDIEVKDSVRNANKIIYENTDSTKFVTMFYGMLDFEDHSIIYCNAGHDRPVYIMGDVTGNNLGTGGIPLGYLPDFEYEQENIQVQDKSIVVLYSDGITEAMNREEEEFGLERLTHLIKANIKKSSEEIIKILIDCIYKFTGETEQMDDMTILILKRDS